MTFYKRYFILLFLLTTFFKTANLATTAANPTTTTAAANPATTTAAGTGTTAANAGTTAAGTGNTAAGTGTTAASSGGVNVRLKLGGWCSKDEDCGPANSHCVETDDGIKRCACMDKYGFYLNNTEYLCGLRIKDPKNEFCNNCTNNEGDCVMGETGEVCSCTSSRTGNQCQNLHVKISCASNHLRVCYEPHPEVDMSNGWMMYSRNSAGKPKCNGWKVDNQTSNNDTFCTDNKYLLSLPMDPKQIDTCQTHLINDSLSLHFSNQIHVANDTSDRDTKVFNVFCTFNKFVKEKFDGVGVIIPNGNDQGEVVKAKLQLLLTNQFGGALPMGSSIREGDLIKYHVTLLRDANYKSIQVVRCTASSSFIMPDTNAEIRPLISNGCPIKSEKTHASWYWSVTENTEAAYKLSTKPIPMFKLSSTEVVYLHCAIKLCVAGFENQCPLLTETDCTNKRRKRDLTREKRQTVETGSVVTSLNSFLRVISPDGSTGGGAIILAVVFSILVVVLVLAIILAVVYVRNKKIKVTPERFASPKIQNTSHKF